MSKLSPTLKACINASYARPGTIAAPRQIRSVFRSIAQEAAKKDVGQESWLAISTAATMTMNSPESLTELFHLASDSSSVASSKKGAAQAVSTAELMREVGLKCISFNGIPRTINCLGEFRASLPKDVITALSTTPTRTPTPTNLPSISTRGLSLWTSIYHPFSSKLLDKLSASHPDLPIHILNSHYGPLLSDPPSSSSTTAALTTTPPVPRVGRILTSLVAISCLRAQTGVGPQVTSHIFGLRKAFDGEGDGAAGEAEIEAVKGGRWLASDEGNLWILKCVDSIVEAIGGAAVAVKSSFGPGMVKAKL